MFSSNNTTAKDMWTRHVLKTCEKPVTRPKNALLTLTQKRSLENLFAALEATILSTKDLQSTKSLHGDGEVDAQIAVPFAHITRRSSIGEKRASLEIPRDLQRRHSIKRRRAIPMAPQQIECGATVEIVTGAKKKFIGLTGTVEKFLANKGAWGIMLQNGHRIALGSQCLRIVTKTPQARHTPCSPPSQHRPPLRRARTAESASTATKRTRALRSRVVRPPMIHTKPCGPNRCSSVSSNHSDSGHNIGARPSGVGLTANMHGFVPASRTEMKEFKNHFPTEIRPKTHKQTMLAACVTGRPDIIMALVVGNKVDINAEDGSKMHESLIHLAIENGNAGCALLLIEMGINVDKRDAQGRTPLILASEGGLTKTVVALCRTGVHVNISDDQERSPLMIAAMNGHHEVVSVLLENGANIELTDKEKHNALTLAMRKDTKNHKQCVEMLIQHMYKLHSSPVTSRKTGQKVSF